MTIDERILKEHKKYFVEVMIATFRSKLVMTTLIILFPLGKHNVV